MAKPNPALVPGASPRPIQGSADVLEQLDVTLRTEETATNRDALVGALSELAIWTEWGGEYAAAQSDLGRSTDEYLDGLGSDRGYGRGDGESDPDYLARIVAFPEVVTEDAIRAEVNAILARTNAGECQLFDGQLDRWFVHSGLDGLGNEMIWHSFIGIGPEYPDRYLASWTANGLGDALPYTPNSDPGGAWAFADAIGRLFVLRVPDLEVLNGLVAYAWSGAAQNGIQPEAQNPPEGLYAGNGSGSDPAAYINPSAAPAEAVYSAIRSRVDRMAGQSIRWVMWSDARLNP